MYPICYNAAVPKNGVRFSKYLLKKIFEIKLKIFINVSIIKAEKINIGIQINFICIIFYPKKRCRFSKRLSNSFYRLPFRDFNLPNFSERIKNGVYNDYHVIKDCDLEMDQKIVNTLIQSNNIFKIEFR